MVYEIWNLEKDIDHTGGDLLRRLFDQQYYIGDDIQQFAETGCYGFCESDIAGEK
ncbi:hypothetical protein [Hungatella sp.]|uniref:hypothetical protein n=1 Tax=Hungatella sp. TaxID=2613924 RepID=UPI002A821D9C|nr:hypothetical protein [Hungatella sp.]